MSAKFELLDYDALDRSTPSSDNVVGGPTMHSRLETIMSRAPEAVVFRGAYTSPKLLLIVAPPHFGITTLVKSYCRENAAKMFYSEISSAITSENIEVLKQQFDAASEFVDALTDESTDRRFVVYVREPLYVFYNQDNVSAIFLSKFEALRDKAGPKDWCVILRSVSYPTRPQPFDKCSHKFFRAVDILIPYQCPSKEERAEVIKVASKMFLRGRLLDDRLIDTIANDTANIGLGQIVAAIGECCTKYALRLLFDNPHLSDSKDVSVYVPDENAIFSMLRYLNNSNNGFVVHPDFYRVQTHPDIRTKMQDQNVFGDY